MSKYRQFTSAEIVRRQALRHARQLKRDAVLFALLNPVESAREARTNARRERTIATLEAKEVAAAVRKEASQRRAKTKPPPLTLERRQQLKDAVIARKAAKRAARIAHGEAIRAAWQALKDYTAQHGDPTLVISNQSLPFDERRDLARRLGLPLPDPREEL